MQCDARVLQRTLAYNTLNTTIFSLCASRPQDYLQATFCALLTPYVSTAQGGTGNIGARPRALWSSSGQVTSSLANHGAYSTGSSAGMGSLTMGSSMSGPVMDPLKRGGHQHQHQQHQGSVVLQFRGLRVRMGVASGGWEGGWVGGFKTWLLRLQWEVSVCTSGKR